MLMLILMTLNLMQGHSGSAKAKYQRCMLLATKQAIRIKLAIFYMTLTLQMLIWVDHLVFVFCIILYGTKGSFQV